ncbi:hypothetical protein [Streptomyces sp. 142MFCol3.1]|uniref:hypothetical protein n=1 Tax=Streptomyces sp. 142MFCol3.1 TaxID=1172179 RepID=UPI0018F89DA5|nr:hypothetical protein [Streptomyces sp. 142MFCol3.1]
MSTLMRAPRECGSWFWDLDEVAAPGLESALAMAARMADVLGKHELLTPHRLEYDWYVLDSGGIDITTSLALTVPLGDPRLPERVLRSRPSGFPDAEVDDIHVVGTGTWIDSQGKTHREPRLVDLSVSPAPVGLSAELAVHHDVWGWFDFAGRPHPDVHQHNAPRLAAALQDLNSSLGVKGEPGEVTYFGFATELGIGTPDALDDGSGPDVTDRL